VAKNTPKNRKGSTKRSTPSLSQSKREIEKLPIRSDTPHPTPNELKSLVAQARARLNVPPTKEDRETTQRILTLYHDKHTPPMFEHVIWRIFYDACQKYDLSLPNHVTEHWRPFWPLLIARLRHDDSYSPTTISYTWGCSDEREAALDEQDRIETQTEAIFDLLHDARMRAYVSEHLKDDVMEILDRANPYHTWEVFRVAWPLALDRIAEENKQEGSASDE
jgi:hypothetical protein